MDPIAQYDQQASNLKSWAQVLGAYFSALLRHGFERQEAMDLVRDYSGATVDHGLTEGDEPVG